VMMRTETRARNVSSGMPTSDVRKMNSAAAATQLPSRMRRDFVKVMMRCS
jgi:hypothetical protein